MNEEAEPYRGPPFTLPAGTNPRLRVTDARQTPVQIWHDDYRGRDRTLFYMGRCMGCTAPTWAFEDGENDPRGVLGNVAYWPVEITHGGLEWAATSCAICANDQDRYRRVVRLAGLELDRRARGSHSPYRSVVLRRVR